MAKRRFTNTEIRKEYDKFSKFYDIAEWPFEIVLARLRRKLLGNLRGNILEIAVGSGRNLKYYGKDCKITAIDISPKMLGLAERRAKGLGLKASFYVGEVGKLQFKNRKFDFVVDSLGLCTFPNPIKAFRKMKRVCKKNGKILLLEHGISNNRFLSKFQHWREERHHERFACSLIRNHEEIAREAGLRIEKMERHFFGVFYVIVARP